MNEIARCEVFLPIVSRSFLESEFAKFEIGFVLRQQAEGRTRVIPVVMDDAGGGRLPLGLTRFHPLDGRGKNGGVIADAVLAELKRLETGAPRLMDEARPEA